MNKSEATMETNRDDTTIDKTVTDKTITNKLENAQATDIDMSRRNSLGTIGMMGLLGGLVGCGGGAGGSETSSAMSSNALSSSDLSRSSSLGSSVPGSAMASSKSRVATSASASSKLASSKAKSSSSVSSPASCAVIPMETIGPFPLSTFLNSSIVMRESINEDKTGVPLKLRLKLVNVSDGCKPISGYVYIWHCDKDGNYSGYKDGNNNQLGKTFCRGLQFTDSNGIANFTTIYPGWYDGRVTHIHFQVFLTAPSGTSQGTAVSQLAFPDATNTQVYNSKLYTKGQNTSINKNLDDGTFSDGVTLQLVKITGDTVAGYTADLDIGLAP
jgi:protocatechuate 3,4-dioxygenase beta subunit